MSFTNDAPATPQPPAWYAQPGPGRAAIAPRQEHGGSSPPDDRPIHTQLDVLPARDRVLVELVAVGETLGQDEAEALVGPGPYERLVGRGLLVRFRNGRRSELRLASPLTCQAVRGRMSAARLRVVARSLAQTIEATGTRRDDDRLRIAALRLMSGGATAATLLEGARVAHQREELALAERLARAAVDAGAGFPAALLAPRLAGLQGNTETAQRELARLAASATDDHQRGSITLARLDNAATWPATEQLQIIDEANRTIRDPAWRTTLRAWRLRLLLHSAGPLAAARASVRLINDGNRVEPAGDYTEQQDDIRADEKAQGDARDGDDWRMDEAEVATRVARAYSLGRLGHLHASLEEAAQGYVTELVSGPTSFRGWAVAMQCLSLCQLGRVEEAEHLAAEHYRRAATDRSSETRALFALVPCTTIAERGRINTVIQRTREALVLTPLPSQPLMVGLGTIYQALALALAGRGVEAAEVSNAVELPPTLYYEIDQVRARAWTSVANGHIASARRDLERAVETGLRIGDRLGQAAALHDLARLGQAKQASQRLAALAYDIDGPLAAARADHATALTHNDPHRLQKASQDFEACGADLLAAEASADAAVVLLRAGDRHKAAAAQRHSALLAERCEWPITPALQGIQARARLTPAEWDTALAAAAGHPSKQIAAELSLSVRTIDNQLQRAYAKVGLSSRSELARALNPPA